MYNPQYLPLINPYYYNTIPNKIEQSQEERSGLKKGFKKKQNSAKKSK
jgi:hypothetical protein